MRKQIETARKAKEKLVRAIYATAGNDSTPFWDCLAIAEKTNPELVRKYHTAWNRITELEAAAISKGRAYRGAFGMLTWSR